MSICQTEVIAALDKQHLCWAIKEGLFSIPI